jgi:hypothetical protein
MIDGAEWISNFAPRDLVKEPTSVPSSSWLLAYFSPESLLPVASIVATVLGLMMMFGRTTLRLIVRAIKPSRFRTRRGNHLEGPHFLRKGRAADGAGKHIDL